MFQGAVIRLVPVAGVQEVDACWPIDAVLGADLSTIKVPSAAVIFLSSSCLFERICCCRQGGLWWLVRAQLSGQRPKLCITAAFRSTQSRCLVPTHIMMQAKVREFPQVPTRAVSSIQSDLEHILSARKRERVVRQRFTCAENDPGLSAENE